MPSYIVLNNFIFSTFFDYNDSDLERDYMASNNIKNTYFKRKFNQKYKSASKNNYKYFMNIASQTEINKSKKFLPLIKHSNKWYCNEFKIYYFVNIFCLTIIN